MIPLHDYADMPADARAGLERTLAPFTRLSHVLDWGRALDPPLRVDDVITQDEYTHDALMRLPNETWLAFDTT